VRERYEIEKRTDRGRGGGKREIKAERKGGRERKQTQNPESSNFKRLKLQKTQSSEISDLAKTRISEHSNSENSNFRKLKFQKSQVPEN